MQSWPYVACFSKRGTNAHVHLVSIFLTLYLENATPETGIWGVSKNWVLLLRDYGVLFQFGWLVALI